jgi:hypothetical protein
MHMKYILDTYILIQIDQSLLPTVLSLSLVYVRTKDVIIDYIFNIFQFLENFRIIFSPLLLSSDISHFIH